MGVLYTIMLFYDFSVVFRHISDIHTVWIITEWFENKEIYKYPLLMLFLDYLTAAYVQSCSSWGTSQASANIKTKNVLFICEL